MKILLSIAVVLPALTVALRLWQRSDRRHAERVWHTLAQPPAAARPPAPQTALFDPDSVAALPDPARRYFLFTIAPGTPLRTVAEISMHGEIALGDGQRPAYRPMRAGQILAPPRGLVWRMTAGSGPARLSGSDGFDGVDSVNGVDSWTRFWLAGTVPVVRAGGDPDHARSAFGRLVAEAAFWTPAALLPVNGARWEAVSETAARATVGFGGLSQSVQITVAADGRPTAVEIPRWTNANPAKVFREQPFGGFLSDFRVVDGYRLPMSVEGGNFFGEAAYFPFYRARVDTIRFIR